MHPSPPVLGPMTYLLIVELERCKKVDLAKKWFSYWRRDPWIAIGPQEKLIVDGPQSDQSSVGPVPKAKPGVWVCVCGAWRRSVRWGGVYCTV